MNKQSPKQTIFTYGYDSIKLEAVKQHEIMLISIHHFWMSEIKKARLFVSSEKKHSLNVITIRLTSAMVPSKVKQLLEAMNLAAYFAVHPDRLSEQYELAAKTFVREEQS